MPYQNYSAGIWSDDTGMTLAMCMALIRVEVQYEKIERAFRDEFYRWTGGSECRMAGKTVLFSVTYRKTDKKS